MRIRHLHTWLAAPVAATLMLGAATQARSQEIKIGYNTDMSASGAAEFSISGLYGLQAAVDEVNSHGGVLGRKLAVVVRDDMAQPPKAIQNTQELVDNEKVVAVFGAANSGNVLAWSHIVQDKKIPAISPIGTATDITKRYAKTDENYLFRVSMVDREQISMLLAYAVRASKNKKIAFIVDSTGYGQQGLKDLNEVAKLDGFTPVAVEKFGAKDTDMTSQLSKIKESGADVLVIYGLADANAYVLRSMEKIDYAPITLGSWANVNTPVVRLAGGKLAERLIFTASTTEDSNPRARQLNETIRKTHPDMTAFVTAAQAYDSTMLLVAAIKQANSTDGQKVQQALENLPSVPGVIKTYDRPFSKTNHEALSVADFHLARWKDGRIVHYDDAITKSLTAADYKR